MSLIRIPSDVEKKISACSDVKSFIKAIEELVYNAFDAKSTSIAIRVFIQECSIQVVDNGCGISKNDFRCLGRRYMTSKFRSTLHEEPIQNYGYRGLSLASIIDVSQKVKITSRCKETDNTGHTYTKTFIEGKEQDISKTTTRPSKGTTVDISGFLYNLHIQKNTINPTTEITLIRSFLEQVSLIHCNTSISLRDDCKNEIIFQINKHRDINQTLQSLFDIESKDIQELQVEKNEYKIHGFIEKINEGHKNYHYIYINGRFINNSRIHYNINKKLKSKDCNRITKTKKDKCTTPLLPAANHRNTHWAFRNSHKLNETRRQIRYFTPMLNEREVISRARWSNSAANQKDNFKVERITSKNIPFYFIFIKCPPSDYDINHTSEQTFIEFKNWEKIDKLIEKFVKFYNGDLKLKKINGNFKKNIEETNKDTRKQVEEIMEKVLGNNSKKRKGLRIQTGIIGKNVTRKQKNKAPESSISKIVSKQFKSNLNKIKKINKCESIQSKNSRNLTVTSANTNKYFSIENNSETRIETDCFQNKQNKKIPMKSENERNIRISQDRLNIKFENPTDTVLRRYNILCDELNHFIPDKGINHFVASNRHVKFIANYTMQQETDVRINNPSFAYNKNNDIKTSYDLVKSIFNCEELLKVNLRNRRDENKQSGTKSDLKKKYTIRKTYKHKLSYESHNYSEDLPEKTKRKFISNSSCNNFQVEKSHNTKPLLIRQEIRRKANRDYFFHRNLYQSIQTIETFESHYDKDITKSNHIEDKSYISHRSTYQTFTSNLQQTYNAKEVITSNMQNNMTEYYDLHKTYTIEVSNSKNYYNLENKVQLQKIDINNTQCDDANMIFLSEPNSKNISQCINPLNVCETVFQNYDLENTAVGEDFDITNKNLEESRFNHNSNGNNQHVNNEENILHKDDTIDTYLKENTISANERNKNTFREQIAKVTNEKLPFEVNVETDNYTNKEGFKLNSRFRFIPKGMSQITAIQLPKKPDRSLGELEENYYEKDIYENFATNLQIYSDVLEPGIQNLNDLTTKGMRSIVSKPNNDSSDPIFYAKSLKEAKVLGQVDYKFIGAKVTGKYFKSNLTSEFLVLFDQHAVDERIRLENNLSDYFDGDKWTNVTLDTFPLKFPKEVTTYLHNYKEKFARFGLEWAFKDDFVFIKSIPKAILGKKSRPFDIIMKAVKSLVSEQIEAIKSLKGNVSLHPKSIMDLVLSEACRYAIKFGDSVSKTECEELLRALSKCKLPFQCAHGRPVMAVMMELPPSNYEYKVNVEKLKRFKMM